MIEYFLGLLTALVILCPFYIGALLRLKKIEGEMCLMTNPYEAKTRYLIYQIGQLGGRQPARAGSPQKVPFQGEAMTCVLCDRTETSNPAIESQWRSIDLDDDRFYICPDEFPPDLTGTVQDFTLASELIFAAALLKSIEDPPHHLLDQLQSLRDSTPWRQNANST